MGWMDRLRADWLASEDADRDGLRERIEREANGAAGHAWRDDQPGGISQAWIKPGRRVRIHPACDWFMRGEHYATVVVPRDAKPGYLRVEGERSLKRFWLRREDVVEVLEQVR